LFDGTLLPLSGAVCGMSTVGFAIMLHMGRIERQLPA